MKKISCAWSFGVVVACVAMSSCVCTKERVASAGRAREVFVGYGEREGGPCIGLYVKGESVVGGFIAMQKESVWPIESLVEIAPREYEFETRYGVMGKSISVRGSLSVEFGDSPPHAVCRIAWRSSKRDVVEAVLWAVERPPFSEG